ncbi:signal peptidase I [Brevibacterium oceani]|uniref:signal peptidase I n=1 Tax=Brevibacterium oceani TaxID=358099 RepID=UPI001B322413|nr:signal peptidase I [Brevibacterium oceani]
MSEHREVKRGRVGAWFGAALLNILAVLGVVCIVLVILSVVFNISIMMFKTGSMSPTIPAGSIALVRETPAAQMEIGDVVTVDRGEKILPVTHRVVSILDKDAQSGRVTFELRGDANEEKDPEPYTATTVRTVMFSIPGVAPILQQWRNPFLLGGITIAASLLVVWAFWPRRGDEPDETDNPGESDGSADGGEPSASAVRGKVDELRAPARSPKHAVAAPIIVAMLFGGGAAADGFGVDATASGSTGAVSAQSSSEVHGQYLRLKAFGDDEKMLGLSPGSSANWIVDVWVEDADPGTVDLEIGAGQVTEPLASALVVDVHSCDRTSADEGCPEGSRSLLSGVPLTDLGRAPDGNRVLDEMPSEDERRIDVTVSLLPGADAQEVAGETSSVRITALGQGEELSVGPGDPGPDDPGEADADSDGSGTDDPSAEGPGGSGDLPWTGIDGWQWFLLTAFVLIVVGSAVVSRTRRAKQS